jgi:hypothetical protein
VRRSARLGLVLATLLSTVAPRAAADPEIEGTAGSDYVSVEITKHEPGHESQSSGSAPQPASPPPPTYPIRCDDQACQVNPSVKCPKPDEVFIIIWALNEDGIYYPVKKGCFGPGTPPVVRLTQDLVLSELQRVGLPKLTVETNPVGKTLVNLDTIFFTDPTPVTRTLSILGQSVVVEATPATYVWHFGDGGTSSSDSPGAPYPAMDLTHRYAHGKVTMHPSVDTTYSARFRVNGGAWQDVSGTVTIAGSTIDLRVVEATPVLSGNR